MANVFLAVRTRLGVPSVVLLSKSLAQFKHFKDQNLKKKMTGHSNYTEFQNKVFKNIDTHLKFKYKALVVFQADMTEKQASHCGRLFLGLCSVIIIVRADAESLLLTTHRSEHWGMRKP